MYICTCVLYENTCTHVVEPAFASRGVTASGKSDYVTEVSPLLNGRAKAMVVTGSRVEADRRQLAINKYIKSRG